MAFKGISENNTQEEKPLEEVGIYARRKPSSSERLGKETALERLRRAMREYPPLAMEAN